MQVLKVTTSQNPNSPIYTRHEGGYMEALETLLDGNDIFDNAIPEGAGHVLEIKIETVEMPEEELDAMPDWMPDE